MGKQLFQGGQKAKREGSRLGRRESERDPDERRESGRAGREGESGEEADPPRREREAQKPDSELWEERREGIWEPSLSNPGP